MRRQDATTMGEANIRKGDYIQVLGQWAPVINDPETAERGMIQLGKRLSPAAVRELEADEDCPGTLWVIDSRCQEEGGCSTDGECGEPATCTVDFSQAGVPGDWTPFNVCDACAKFYAPKVVFRA